VREGAAGESGRWPLTGRSAELETLGNLLAEGRPGVVLVGAPGTGKTRVAAEFLERARADGYDVLRVQGTRATATVPFGALACDLPSVATSDDGAARIRNYAAALAGQNAPVVLVDDADLLDDLSAAVVQQLALGGRAFVALVCTTGRPAPEPVTALCADEVVAQLEVRPLDDATVDTLLTAALGAPADPAVTAELREISEGDLRILRAQVTGAVADGSLRNENGIWLARGGIAPSRALVALVEQELADLSPAARGALELVAFAEPLGSAEISALADHGVIEQLERRGLVTSRLDRRRLVVTVTRRAHRDVLRAQLPAVRRQSLAQALVELVERYGSRRSGDLMRNAVWRLDGDWASPEIMLTAARTARWNFDLAMAERLARAAVAAGAGFEAALLAAQMAGMQGRSSDALAEFEALAEAATTDSERARVAVAHSNHLSFDVGRIDDGLTLAREVQATLTEVPWRDEITAWTAGVLLAIDGPAATAEAVEPLLERAEGRALVIACFFATIGLGRMGRISDALQSSARGRNTHLGLDLPVEFYPATHNFHRCDTLAFGGRLDEATDLATREYQAALAEHSLETQALFAWELGKLACERGRVQTAERYLREAIALHRELGRSQLVRGCLVHLALALALSGRPAEATETLTTLEAPAEGTPLYTTRIDLLLAWAWLRAAESNLPAARDFAARAATQAQEIGDAVSEGAALHTLARLGRAKEALPRLEELARTIEGPLIQARLTHVGALVANDPDTLESVSGEFAALGTDLIAAEAAADAAVIWRKRSETRAAAAAQRMSELLAGRCERARTPALSALESRAQLTPAERDAAQLAAAGRSSREIAEELQLSVRTVENQLQRVYNKLGVKGRAELRDALAQT
jgi:DNA-binding CsgD family transcriptional regulator